MKKRTYLFIGAAVVFSFICIGAANNEIKEDDNIRTVKIQTIDEKVNTPNTQIVTVRNINPFTLMRARMSNMERQMDQLFNDPFLSQGFVMTRPVFNEANSPELTFKENKNDYIIQVVTPGMDKKDLLVDVKDNMLTVTGQFKSETENKSGNKVISQQQVTNNFTQSLTIPENSDIKKITSDYKNGILSIKIPKDLEKIKENTRNIPIE